MSKKIDNFSSIWLKLLYIKTFFFIYLSIHILAISCRSFLYMHIEVIRWNAYAKSLELYFCGQNIQIIYIIHAAMHPPRTHIGF